MKNNENYNSLFDIDSSFTDYTKFEINKNKRAELKKRFIDGEVWNPDYDYPELNSLYDEKVDEDTGKKSVLAAKKMTLQYAVMELDALRKTGQINEDLAELYASYYELRLKRILLVESARQLFKNRSSSTQESARRNFVILNEELYGEFNTRDFYGIIHSEKNRLEKLDLNNPFSSQIFSELSRYFGDLPGYILENEEIEVLDENLINSMMPVILERYSYVWESVPETPDDKYYNAQECKVIMNTALGNCGLADSGWKAVVSAKKKAPSTSSESKKVSLPSNTNRNAKELRALIVHEVGVHAKRGQNGEASGLKLLKTGTADYADVEEGLGVLLECLVNGSLENPAFHRARDRYIAAGLALGADCGMPRDARQTYEILWRIIAARKSIGGEVTESLISQSKEEAYDHVENAFRGTNFSMPGMIYSKLKVYREGLIKNVLFFKKNMHRLGDALDTAMIGKYNHCDSKEMDLVKRVIAENKVE